jgi:hypothetical protein
MHGFLGLEGTVARSHSLKGIRPGGGGSHFREAYVTVRVWTASRLGTITWNLSYN